MTELQAKIENKEIITTPESQAVTLINIFLKDTHDDAYLFKENPDHKWEINNIADKNVVDAFNAVKNDIRFDEAYDDAEYQQIKKGFIDYVNGKGENASFGHLQGQQDVTDADLKRFDVSLVQTKLAEMNLFTLNNAKPKSVDIHKFMVNFVAEQHKYTIMDVATDDTQSDKQDRTHHVGVIEAKSRDNMTTINTQALDIIKMGYTPVLRIYGVADATQVLLPSNETISQKKDIKSVYDKSRQSIVDKLIAGGNTKTAEKFKLIFAESNKDYDRGHREIDKKYRNEIFALSRALTELDKLDADVLNKTLSARDQFDAKKKGTTQLGEFVLGNVRFNFDIDKQKGDDKTKSGTEIIPTADVGAKQFDKTIDFLIWMRNITIPMGIKSTGGGYQEWRADAYQIDLLPNKISFGNYAQTSPDTWPAMKPKNASLYELNTPLLSSSSMPRLNIFSSLDTIKDVIAKNPAYNNFIKIYEYSTANGQINDTKFIDSRRKDGFGTEDSGVYVDGKFVGVKYNPNAPMDVVLGFYKDMYPDNAQVKDVSSNLQILLDSYQKMVDLIHNNPTARNTALDKYIADNKRKNGNSEWINKYRLSVDN